MYLPRNLLVLALPRFNLQALIVHLMHITGLSHIAEDIFLQIGDRVERVGHVLILLDVADDFGRLGALGKVDEVGVLDNRRDSVFDEGEVGEIDAQEGDARWVGAAQLFAVLAEVFGAGHELAHHVQRAHGFRVDLGPGSV
jgi:hypothetical protein